MLGALLATWWHYIHPRLTDPRAASITKANFDRIQDGMSVAEVNQLLGVPPGDYRSEPGFVVVGPGHISRTGKAQGGKLAIWYIPRYHLEILFDRNGRVIGKYWHDADANKG